MCCLHRCEAKADRLALVHAKCDRGTFCSARRRRSCWTASARRHAGSGCFPGRSGDEPLRKHVFYWLWIKARDAVGIEPDARLHALHHANASHAVMIGESLYVAGRLLGHRRASATNRNARLDYATPSQAGERVAVTVRAKLSQQRPIIDQFGVPSRRGGSVVWHNSAKAVDPARPPWTLGSLSEPWSVINVGGH